MDDYFKGGTKQEQVEAAYGPIEEWDVGAIEDFYALFAETRNSEAEFFNADLSKWDVSKVGLGERVLLSRLRKPLTLCFLVI